QRLMELALKALRGDVLTDTSLWAYTDGTPMIVELSQNAGILPTRNFQDGTFVDFAKLSSPAVQAVRLAKKACLSCGLGCGNYIRTGRAAVEGPEYETLAVAGANCGIGDLEAVAAFNAACDDLGLDTISTGGVVAFAMELTEKGLHDFGITFGDVERYLEMPGLIARREGIGAELAAGVKKMAERFGVPPRVFLRTIAARPDFPPPLFSREEKRIWRAGDVEAYVKGHGEVPPGGGL
ncbi:MAG: aldehyde ferredoxin oxidoreductase C-terminal domain-containing protein, partial [Chloroflexi bacterium]|nr:aldehyde ferredoxin oxidoreductase C-terminal domain-containing protein [Chloroflexota bacterium]